MKQKLRTALTTLLFICSIVVFAGPDTKSVAGKYIDSRNPKDYYELKSDGTFVADSGSGIGAAGTYEIRDDGVIIFKLANGMAARGTLNSGRLTTPDNHVYHKQ